MNKQLYKEKKIMIVGLLYVPNYYPVIFNVFQFSRISL
jgi:hypothetical protein